MGLVCILVLKCATCCSKYYTEVLQCSHLSNVMLFLHLLKIIYNHRDRELGLNYIKNCHLGLPELTGPAPTGHHPTSS